MVDKCADSWRREEGGPDLNAADRLADGLLSHLTRACEFVQPSLATRHV